MFFLRNFYSNINIYLSWFKVFFPTLFFCFLLGCIGRGTAKIVPPQIVTSTNKNMTKPRFLGVNYLYNIGGQKQGKKSIDQPTGIALDASGNIYIADAGNHCIRVLDADGNIIMVLGGFGWRHGEFDNPLDVDVNFMRGEFLYIADTGNDRIQACSLISRVFVVVSGKKSGEVNGSGGQFEIQLDSPKGIATDRKGNIYIADTGNHRFLKLSPQGRLLMEKGEFGWGRQQFREPSDLDVDSIGNIYVSDTGNNRIQKFDFSGNLMTIWGEKGSEPGQLNEPYNIALDSWDNVYIVDHGNNRIQVFDLNGNFLTQFTLPNSSSPVGIAIGKDNKIYVTGMSADDVKVFQSVYR